MWSYREVISVPYLIRPSEAGLNSGMHLNASFRSCLCLSIALVVVLGGCDTGRQAPVTAPSSSFPVTRGGDSSSAPTERPLEIGAEKKDVDRAATNGNSTPELQDKNRAAPKQADQDSASNAPQWTDLFDGKTLGRWQSTQFGGEGEVQVDDGRIVMERGNDLTGVTWKG